MDFSHIFSVIYSSTLPLSLHCLSSSSQFNAPFSKFPLNYTIILLFPSLEFPYPIPIPIPIPQLLPYITINIISSSKILALEISNNVSKVTQPLAPLSFASFSSSLSLFLVLLLKFYCLFLTAPTFVLIWKIQPEYKST